MSGARTQGPDGFCPNCPSELLTGLLRDVQITPKVSDQSRPLGEFKLNPSDLEQYKQGQRSGHHSGGEVRGSADVSTATNSFEATPQ